MTDSRFPRGVCGVAWCLLVLAVWLLGASQAPPRQLMALTALAYLACWAIVFFVSNLSRRQLAMRFVVANLSLVFALGIVEAMSVAGVVDYRRVFGRFLDPWENPDNLLDRGLIHIHRPHLQSKGRLRGGDLCRWINAVPVTDREYDVRYDHNGFRNDSDHSRSDCIVIGDSFIEAGNVLSHELLTTRIAEALGLTVTNLGQHSYGPQQELIVLERFGLPLQPKFCFWVFFEGNDLKDVWRYKRLSAGWPDSVSGFSSRLERSLTKNGLLWLASTMSRFGSAPDLSRSGLLRTDEGSRRMWFAYDGARLSRRDLDALDETTKVLTAAHTMCREHGIDLIVVFVPTKFRVYVDACEFENGSVVRHWKVNDLPRQLHQRVSSIAREIGYLDLTPEFIESALQGVMLYYPDDTHWSPAGHELAGQSMSSFLRANYGEHLSE